MIANGMIILNKPSEYYTFSRLREESDVDIILMQGNMTRCHSK